MEVSREREFSIYLTDRPGELAGVLESLQSAGASVHAISVLEHNGRGLVRLLGTPVETIQHVCEALVDSAAGPVAEAEVLVVDLENNPGLFREVATKLADAEVNVRYAYLTHAWEGIPARCVLRVDDPDRARDAICQG